MKILFDQNVPHKLRTNLIGLSSHEIFTAAHLGWGALKNGHLLLAAEGAGIDVLVTGDLGIVHQQNLAGRPLSIVVQSTNNWPLIKDKALEILRAIELAPPGSYTMVECGRLGPMRNG